MASTFTSLINGPLSTKTMEATVNQLGSIAERTVSVTDFLSKVRVVSSFPVRVAFFWNCLFSCSNG